MSVASSNSTFFEFFAMLSLCALPVTSYKTLGDIFRWFNGVFFKAIPVPAENILQ